MCVLRSAESLRRIYAAVWSGVWEYALRHSRNVEKWVDECPLTGCDIEIIAHECPLRGYLYVVLYNGTAEQVRSFRRLHGVQS